jgi:DNA-binding MarR family transcriptional regulator
VNYVNKEKLAVLEQTTAPRIIVYLKEKEKASISDIFKNVQGSQTAKYSALKLLNENKLTEQSPPEKRTRRLDVSLTEKGKQVADYLIKIEKLL